MAEWDGSATKPELAAARESLNQLFATAGPVGWNHATYPGLRAGEDTAKFMSGST